MTGSRVPDSEAGLLSGTTDWTRASIVLDFGTAPTAVPQHGR